MMRRTMTLRGAAVLAAGLLAAGCAERTEESAVTTTDTAGATAPVVEQPSDALIDPETASREELLRVPGMTPEIADAIIAGRPYDDMLAVDQALAAHADEAQRREMYRAMFKPMDLNTASREEILLIPDVDPRMPHEFDEYRPYTDMAQFRQEMGKYVSAEEVARYEKYVELRQ